MVTCLLISLNDFSWRLCIVEYMLAVVFLLVLGSLHSVLLRIISFLLVWFPVDAYWWLL